MTATRFGSIRLPALIESLRHQDVSEPWEWVVVLDGVMDQSPMVLETLATDLPVRIIQLESALGVAGALARGYAAATGDIVLRCDDDLTLPPHLVSGHLARHAERLSTDPPIGVISPTRDVFEESRYARAYGVRANDELIRSALVRPSDSRWIHWAACNSISKASYLQVGGFDARHRYREDSDLGYRLASSGVEIIIDPLLEVLHRGPLTSARTRAERAYVSGASRQEFVTRHPESMPKFSENRTVWTRIVEGTSSGIHSRASAARLGAVVDHLLPLIPSDSIRNKAVALTVEAAALASRGSAVDEWKTTDTPAASLVDQLSARVANRRGPWQRMASCVVGFDGHRPQVAVTYDDGPTPGVTDTILEELEARGARATFFVLANRAAAEPGLLREVQAAGHEIALHGPDHRRLTQFTARQVEVRTRASREQLEDLIGTQVSWFRAPYGAMGMRAVTAVRRAGLTPVHWSAGVYDWLDIPEGERLALAMQEIDRGGILLAHDGFAGPSDGVDDGPEPCIDRRALTASLLDHLENRGLTSTTLQAALSTAGPTRRVRLKQ